MLHLPVVILLLTATVNFAVGKNLDLTHTPAGLGHHSQHGEAANTNNNRDTCESMKGYFEQIDVQVNFDDGNKGRICGGQCCSNATETELKRKAISDFERLLRDHTRNLRGVLESTSSLFRNHILELSQQSEIKTLHVFSQVYRRMLPQSQQLIHHLYSNITAGLNATRNTDLLDTSIHDFFVNLFPIAYHQTVHLNNHEIVADSSSDGDLHDDYINCLKHTFDDLKPFGNIPYELTRTLTDTIGRAMTFIDALEESAAVLASTDDLDSKYLTATCQTQLLKMSYCPACNGIHRRNVKTCYSYCMNVMRGCLTQYVGDLDGPWSKAADAIEHLVPTSMPVDKSIITVIKGLDAKLSEAIMHAMENAIELEKKVKKTCGTPKLIPVSQSESGEIRPTPQPATKWATPPDVDFLKLSATIDQSKDFYSRIVNNVCEDDDIQRNDRHCWTGDRIGDYTQTVMSTEVDAQRYNPEVPLAPHSLEQERKLHELADRLIKIRKSIGNSIPSKSRTYSDIQGDMAQHDEEGSGLAKDDVDNEEYNIYESGDGSGDGPTSMPDNPMISPRNNLDSNNEPSKPSSAMRIASPIPTVSILVLIITYVVVPSRH